MQTKRAKSAGRVREMREPLSEFDVSGETVKAFCGRKGISAWSIYYWRRRLREGTARKPGRA